MLSDVKSLVAQIREYENSAIFAKRTNERELPNLKFLVSDLDKFAFGNEDLDLKQRFCKVSEKIQSLEVTGITNEVLDSLRTEVSSIRDELIKRYTARMENYASRQGNI